MSAKTLAELFLWQLKDVYGAEQQILKALPKMAEKANSAELRKAFETHEEETKGHVQRLNKVFEALDMKPAGEKCAALQGIVDEAEEVMSDAKDPAVLDAGMIGAAQAVEHYEIARYGTLIAWAEELGKKEIVSLLEQTLKEEKKADEILSRIAMQSVNRKAA